MGEKNKAFDYFAKAKNDARAIYLLALKKAEEKNFKEALRLFLDAIDLGEEKAIHSLCVYLDCQKGYELELENAKKEHEKKASKGDCKSLNVLGVLTLMYDEKDTDKAMSYFEKASKQNYANSTFYLGLMYERGFGDIEPDIQKAIGYFKIAASNNHMYSINRLADINYLGKSAHPYHKEKSLSGKEKINDSDHEAIVFYEKTVPFRSVKAFKNLAWYHMRGVFTEFNPDKSKQYAEKALCYYTDKTSLNEDCNLNTFYTVLTWYYYYEKRDFTKSLQCALRALRDVHNHGESITDVILSLKKLSKNKKETNGKDAITKF